MADDNGQHPKSIEDINTDYLLCRDLGHAWRPHDVKISRKYGEIHRILQCRNCPTQRSQILDMDGYPKRNKYDYPEGYTMAKGSGHLSIEDRAHIRVMSTNHMKGTG